MSCSASLASISVAIFSALSMRRRSALSSSTVCEIGTDASAIRSQMAFSAATKSALGVDTNAPLRVSSLFTILSRWHVPVQLPLNQTIDGSRVAVVRTNRKAKEAERRQTQCFATAPAGAGRATERAGLRRPSAAGALACRRSTDGSRQRESVDPQGSASGHASWDPAISAATPSRSAFRRQKRRSLCGCYPSFTCPSPAMHLAARSLVPDG